MYIRSKHRTNIVNTDNSTGIAVVPTAGPAPVYQLTVLMSNNVRVVVGTYDTEARAKAVLDDIFAEILLGHAVYDIPID